MPIRIWADRIKIKQDAIVNKKAISFFKIAFLFHVVRDIYP